MKNHTDYLTPKKVLKVVSDGITYTLDEICPICGKYSVDGEVCVQCLTDYKVYKPRNVYEVNRL